ncbi:type VII secretion integral membrane protein EccD [Mycobacterium sp. 852002-51163_SCH5372311]|uniref:type VII secretion integral membrane protein EccD n=1 Tax=Mycobacterium sp. 852002-51163_SCH5372311 TaxID=1834097 RepID=UPI0007FCBBE0|nr:type VII secretion integral membrane protein EccD [Mycobacterium sp. 852002-51163_SCH5372311]OBF80493.1 type VII secretion integral membrane protein EccD [Mycobacterium sp. 852002-51163_SCH5372311]
MFSASDPGLRRVCVHAGESAVDLALPAAVPVATLIPSIIDILDSRSANHFPTGTAARYQLCRPGSSAFPMSTTLAQNGIRDGAVLVLYPAAVDIPAPVCDDSAESVSEALEAADPAWNRQAAAAAAGCITGVGCLVLARNALYHNASGITVVVSLAALAALAAAALAHRGYQDRIAGLTLSVIAIAFAAVAGLLAIPGPPGAAHVLLAAMTAVVASVLAIRVTGGGAITLTALSCYAVAVAAAALAAVLTAAPLHVIGSVSALVSLGLLEASARLSLTLAGLSPHLTSGQVEPAADCPSSKAIRADAWLTSLLAAFSASAATGAIAIALAGRGASRIGCIALAALTAALLLLRINDGRNMIVYVVSGIATAGTTFAVVAAGIPACGAWIAGMTALAAAAAIYLGFVAPARPLAPAARRGIEVLECLVLVAMVPLTGWVCGLYSAVRSVDLR